MNTSTQLDNSHQRVIQAVENLNETAWDVPGACGEWSVKEVVAHLAAREYVLVDILKTFQGEEPTPTLLSWAKHPDTFDATKTEERGYLTAQQVEDEYQEAQVESGSLLKELPEELVHKPGTMPWYNTESSLADVVQFITEHSSEHCQQIARFKASGKGQP